VHDSIFSIWLVLNSLAYGIIADLCEACRLRDRKL